MQYLVRVLKGIVTTEEVAATQRGIEYIIRFINSEKNLSSVFLSDKTVLVETKAEAKVEARAMKKRYPHKIVACTELIPVKSPRLDHSLVDKALKERYGKGCKEVKYRMPQTCKTCIHEPSTDEERKGILCLINPRPEDGEDGVCLGSEEDKEWRKMLTMAGDGNYTLRSALFPDTDKIGDYRG